MSQLSAIASFDPPRRHTRIPVALSVKLCAADGGVSATLADLSSGGLFVACQLAPPADTPVTLGFRLLGSIECVAYGRVVWSQTGRGFGVAFDEVSAQMASFTHNLGKMKPKMRQLYLAGVLHPQVRIG